MLRTKILQQAKKNNWRRIALVSPGSSCGKTTTAANLGFSFSRMSELRTIVMDFDLRRMGLGKVLGQTVNHGMREVLQGQAPFSDVGLCHDGNVVFGLNSKTGTNPSEILQSQQAADVLDEIEDLYKPDIMLFDTPPLMSSDDSHGFLRSVDCALMLAVAEKTPMDQIDVAERQLSELTNVMGIVLNRCRYTTGAHGYENEYY
ncbi:MAG: CpsD/CapB family tyrosine-protein kinase [Sedimentitalea sp.]